MKKKLLPLVSLSLFVTFLLPGEGANIKQFGWLEGNWSMKANRGTITESWKMNHDSSMLGNSKMILPGGEERILENLELAYTNGNYYYISGVNGQNNGETVKFKITSHSENGFVAENPQHDFPKRITYKLVKKDSIHAFVDGGPSMPEKKSGFYYSRKK